MWLAGDQEAGSWSGESCQHGQHCDPQWEGAHGALVFIFFYNLGDANICRVMNSSQILVGIFFGFIKYSCCDVHKNVTFLQ